MASVATQPSFTKQIQPGEDSDPWEAVWQCSCTEASSFEIMLSYFIKSTQQSSAEKLL